MKVEDKARLYSSHVLLTDSVNFRDISTQLLQDGALVQNDYEKIAAETTESDRIKLLLDILIRQGGSNTFDSLMTSLRVSGSLWLAESIENTIITNDVLDKYNLHDPAKKSKLNLHEQVNQRAVNVLRRNNRMPTTWPTLARLLGLGQYVNDIRIKINLYCEDQLECIDLLMDRWRGLKGKEATIGELVDALRQINCADVADELEQEFET